MVVDDGVRATSQRNGVSMHEPAIAAATPSLPWFARMLRRLGRISNLGNVSESRDHPQASDAVERLCNRRWAVHGEMTVACIRLAGPPPPQQFADETSSISPTASNRASLRASSRSVFRLTCFHCQADPVVLATRAESPAASQRSSTQPACEQASKTIATGSRARS